MATKNYAKILAKKILCVSKGYFGPGENVYISPRSEISDPGKIFLDDDVVLERHSRLSASRANSEIRIGAYTTIFPYALLKANGGKIKIGKACTVNDYSILYGNGGIDIGEYVHIAAHVVIVAFEHVYERLEAPDFGGVMEGKGIRIEDNVWIGANAVILDGVTIGKGAVIGAGAVVTGDIPAYSVAVGVPAKVMRRWK